MMKGLLGTPDGAKDNIEVGCNEFAKKSND